jgi:tetratricopeptide (TPR) repeat protein
MGESGWWRFARFANLPSQFPLPSGEPTPRTANMRYPRSCMIVVLLATLSAVGCRLPGRQGPVPQSLAECRRLSQQGVAALDRGRQQDAEALLAKAVAACPADAEARRHYAESLWRRGARREAIAQLEESSRLAGDDATISARLAEMYLANDQLELARQNADRAVDLDPRLPGAWAIRGKVFRTAGLTRDALADDLRALGYAPKDRETLLEVAELYRQDNRPERALQTLQTLAETYSPGEEPGQVLHLLGLAYVALGRCDDAVESLSLAVARGKPTPEMFCDLGEVQLLLGHPTEAAVAAQQALAIQPQHRPSLALLEHIQLAQQPQGTLRK